jgi:hypothetical protein
MKKAVSLYLGILKSLYPWANLDATREGFATTYTKDEPNKLVEDSATTTSQIMEMLPVDMS